MSEFEKTPAQKKAINLLSGVARHCLLFGGSRSGKSFIIIYALIVRACKIKCRQVILRLAFNAVKTSVWMDTLPKVLSLCFPELTVIWNKSDYFVSFPNGSELWVGGLDDDKRVEKILGKEFSSIFFNECSQLSYSAVQMALTRLAEKNELKKKVYYDLNPDSKNSWVYYQFIKGLNPADDEPLKRPQDYAWTKLSPKDNLANVDEEYLSMLESLPEKERLRFLDGEFAEVGEGLVYYAFNSDQHVRDTIQDNGTIFIGLDFNVDPMCGVICQYINGTFHIQEELYLRNSDTYQTCSALKRRNLIGTVIPDSTAKNRRTSGKSDLQILKENGFTVLPTHNPYVTDRTNNINRLFTQNRIIINPKCKKLINDLSKVIWKDNKLDQKTDPLLTHISDALGYLCWKLDPINTMRKSTQRIV